MDNKVFNVVDAVPGENMPPMHPWCRSTTIAELGDEMMKNLTRAARDPVTGEQYTVPANMTYEEWKKEIDKKHSDGTFDKMRKMHINEKSDREQYKKYIGVLGKDNMPKSFDKFQLLKYNNINEWDVIKQQYKVVNQYKVDSGYVSVEKILEMDKTIILEKRNNFPSAYKKSGNIAGAYINTDDALFLAHSQINNALDNGYRNYKGSSNVVLLHQQRAFEYMDVLMPDGSMRNKTYYDTEAKLFEEFHTLLQTEEFTEITMLSERGMCDSCKDVMEQFKKAHPNVKVNVVSHKKVNSNVWKYRLRK